MPGKTLHILGGGPAGLAAAYYALKRGLEPIVFEAGSEVGGNCRTLRLGDFLFDTGAHRWHDKDAESTREVQALLGAELHRVEAPSQICLGDKRIGFPLAPLDLLRQLDLETLGRIAWENVRQRRPGPIASFGDYAIAQYGPTLAGLLLNNYSQKLWGVDPFALHTEVSGGRLKGLDLRSFLSQALPGRRRRARHLDGSFLYPKYGIGMVSQALAQTVGPQRIHCNSRITRMLHADGRITAIEVNGSQRLDVSTVVNTLPLSLACRILDPAPPHALRALVKTIRYRHVVLGVFALDRAAFTPNASLYFPDPAIPFTRIYEPKNRSRHMAPPGQTAIVVETPCFDGDEAWRLGEAQWRQRLWPQIQRLGDLGEGEMLDYRSYKLPFAYPVLETGYAEKAAALVDFFSSFDNLHLSGRSALFRYSHLHDQFKAGRELADEISS
jgi:protoporphyrinogen oxidase